MSNNKCLQCAAYIYVQFEYGQEIKYCNRLKIPLTDRVIHCTEFCSKNRLQNKLEEYELLDYVESIKPWIIDLQKNKAGFSTENDVIIRPATNKDKKNED